jgi:DNA polymerase-3 subunit gamma/tau
MNGYTPLMLAAANDDLVSVRAELERAELSGSAGSVGPITATTVDGRNALMLGAAAGHVAVVELLALASTPARSSCHHPAQPAPSRPPASVCQSGVPAAAGPQPQPAAAAADSRQAPPGGDGVGVGDPIDEATAWLPAPKRDSMRSTLRAMQPAARDTVLQRLIAARPAPPAPPPPASAPAPAAAPPPGVDQGSGGAEEGAAVLRPPPAPGLLGGLDVHGNNALHLAAFRGHRAVVEL